MGVFSKLSIARKLPLLIVGSALIVGLGIGISAYLIGLQTVDEQRQENMEASLQASSNRVADFLDLVGSDLRLFGSRPETATAIENMSAQFEFLDMSRGGAAALLQQSFITENPNPAGQRQLLDSVGKVAGNYDVEHQRFHPGWRSLAAERQYGDVYLIDKNGNVVYSVSKNLDFATNVAAGGDAAATGLGQAFARASGSKAEEAVFVDFDRYAPASGSVEAFMAMPVYRNQTFVGVMAIAILPQSLTERVSSVTGLGTTGEALIVGADGLMRTQSRLSMASDVLRTSVDTPVVRSALDGVKSTAVVDDFRGTQTVVMAQPFTQMGVDWAIVAVQAQDEVMAPVIQMRNLMLAVGAGLLIVTLAVGLLFSRSISRPITRLTRSMGALADGQLDVEIDGTQRGDEIGAMSRAVEVFKRNSQRVIELNAEQVATSDATRAERAQMMQDLQRAFGVVVDAAVEGDFGRRVDMEFPDDELNQLARSVNLLVETVDRGLRETGEVLSAMAETDLTRRMHGEYQGAFAKLKADTNAVADTLSRIVTQLGETSGALKTATSELLAGANDLSERTTRQAATIEETSAAMDQLASTVSQNAEKARAASLTAGEVTRTAEDGGTVMQQANEAMARIEDSSRKISSIIKLIDDIAFQTNLLALNASVEAARAGEAGKGFAVVAVEVRRLAQSAAGASRDVKALIEQSGGEVRSGSKLVGDAAQRLIAMVEAARQNHAAMETIARQSREQAASIEEVNTAVRTLDEMTQHNAALVEQTNAAIEQTEQQASELDRIVDRFTLGGEVQPEQKPAEPVSFAAPAPSADARGIQARLKAAAKTYLSRGNAAVDEEWAEF